MQTFQQRMIRPILRIWSAVISMCSVSCGIWLWNRKATFTARNLKNKIVSNYTEQSEEEEDFKHSSEETDCAHSPRASSRNLVDFLSSLAFSLQEAQMVQIIPTCSREAQAWQDHLLDMSILNFTNIVQFNTNVSFHPNITARKCLHCN